MVEIAAAPARRVSPLCVIWFFLTIASAAQAYAQGAAYTVTQIDPLPGHETGGSGAHAIAGDYVAGTSAACGSECNPMRALRYSGGVLEDLGTLGGPVSRGNGVNSRGDVVGDSLTGFGNSPTHAFLYRDGTMLDLGTLGGTLASALAVNTRGEVVGYSAIDPSPTSRTLHAFLYRDGQMIDLGTLGTDSDSHARDINASGQIIGVSGDRSGNFSHVFLYENGIMRDLGRWGGYGADAYAINDAGQIVGTRCVHRQGTTDVCRAFVYDSRTDIFTELAIPADANTTATGINATGDIVGYVQTGLTSTAFLYRNGVYYELNDLIAGSGWTLRDAFGINDAGQIVGTGTNPQGESRGFLLTPVNSSTWSASDIGDVGLAGHSTIGDDGVFHVTGAGRDIWDTADSFHFLHRSFTGDGALIAHVTGITNTHPFAKAGIMLRDGLSPGAAQVILNVKPDGFVEFMQRSTPAGETTYLGGIQTTGTPWLRLQRLTGTTVVATVGTDDSVGTYVGTATVAFGATVQAGLAVTSHDAAQLNASAFAGVRLLGSPWTARDVGPVGLAGVVVGEGDRFTISGAGDDIWGRQDSFHYVSQPIESPREIVARVVSQTSTHPFAKAGVMLRLGAGAPGEAFPDASSPFVILDVKPDGGIEFMRRGVREGPTEYLAGAFVVGPAWLRLSRSGTSVTASVSTDGVIWTPIGSAAVPGEPFQRLGLAVTSHDSSVFNTAVVDHVIVRP